MFDNLFGIHVAVLKFFADEPQRGRNSSLWLQSRSVVSSFGVVLIPCRVNFHVVRSAIAVFCLQNLICMQMNAWRGFPRVCFTRPLGNREGNFLLYIERIDDHGTSVCVCVCFFFLNSEQ